MNETACKRLINWHFVGSSSDRPEPGRWSISAFRVPNDAASMQIGTLRPLCRIDLDHAGVTHHSDLAIRSDAGKAFPSIEVDGHSVEFSYPVPLPICNRQLIDSRFPV